MNWLDLAILAVLAISVITAFFHGLVVEVFSLAGVVVGIMVASARYGELARHLPGWMNVTGHGDARDLTAFLLIAVAIMVAAGLVGRLVRGTIRVAGLGIFDRLLGAAFGLVKGFVLVTLAVMAMMAFFPGTQWPARSRLMPVFVKAAHGGAEATAEEFGTRIRQGIQFFRAPAPRGTSANRAEAGQKENE